MKLHCNPLNTYTLYFNILFYIALIVGNSSYSQGIGLHVIPFFVLAEYLVWFKGLAGSCGWKTRNMLIAEFIGHWVIFIIYIYLQSSGKLDNGDNVIYGFISPFILFILYLFIIKFNMRIYNGIDMRPYLLVYILLLAIVTTIWYFID